MGKSKMFALMAASMLLLSDNNNRGAYPPVCSALSEEEKQAKQREINIRKGLKEFNIDGTKVWALNRKSAIKKLKKKQ